MAEVLTAPVVSWRNVELFEDGSMDELNSNKEQIAQPYDFGVIDAGYEPEAKDYYSFLIWNNYNSKDFAPMMEEVTFGIKDMGGGNGDTAGNLVPAINGSPKWFYARVDTLGQTGIPTTEVGADQVVPIGTTGSTLHPKIAEAVKWSASTSYNVGQFIKPSTDNGFIYEVTKAGTSGTEEPTWATVDGDYVENDGTVQYKAIKKEQTTDASEDNHQILGIPNNGDLIEAGANYARVTLRIFIPLDARAGRQDMKLRVKI